MFIAIDYIQKTNIILPFSQPKKIVVKNVQYSIFRQFFTHFYFFFSLYNHSSSYTFFFLLVFLLPFVYCCAFILFFPISTPCIFSKHFYTFYVSYVSYFFLCFVNKNTRYTILYTEQKNYLFFPSKKKEKNFPKKSYYDIKLLCNLYKIIYMCLPSYQK